MSPEFLNQLKTCQPFSDSYRDNRFDFTYRIEVGDMRMHNTPSPQENTELSYDSTDETVRTARDWAKLLLPYRRADLNRGLTELGLTLIPFVLLWWAAILAYPYGVHWSVLISLPAALFLVRLFAIQHDCGHGSFFRTKRMNDIIGSGLAVLTVTPYYVWKQAHKQHHATSGHLDRRGIGAIQTLTVEEYEARTFVGRLIYRLYRNPATLFLIGPAYVFFLQNRVPVEFLNGGWRYWFSAMGTNLGIALLAGGLIWMLGLTPFLMVFLSTTLMAAVFGVWLFYVQHQFEETHWRRSAEWDVQDAALYGSSHYDLPGFLRWATANIGIHHVHHLNSRIPSYRLNETLSDHPELREINRLTLWSSLASVNLHLWDEAKGRLISFSEWRRGAMYSAA